MLDFVFPFHISEEASKIIFKLLEVRGSLSFHVFIVKTDISISQRFEFFKDTSFVELHFSSVFSFVCNIN